MTLSASRGSTLRNLLFTYEQDETLLLDSLTLPILDHVKLQCQPFGFFQRLLRPLLIPGKLTGTIEMEQLLMQWRNEHPYDYSTHQTRRHNCPIYILFPKDLKVDYSSPA